MGLWERVSLHPILSHGGIPISWLSFFPAFHYSNSNIFRDTKDFNGLQRRRLWSRRPAIPFLSSLFHKMNRGFQMLQVRQNNYKRKY